MPDSFEQAKPAPRQEDSMLLNASVIEEVRETLGDDILRAFLARMLAEVEETAETLRGLLAVQDYATLATTAHRASGSAASVGASGLHAALKDIENTARQPGAVAELPGLVAALSDRTVETRTALSAILGTG
jgi:HPt (histidine-containing phosphotransfer) domain-containing protein